jgi:hypothetical protein
VLSLLFICGCKEYIYNYSSDNAIEILQKEKIKHSFYHEYFCNVDTLPKDTIVLVKKIKEYDKNGQCIKENEKFYNTYTICYYENEKPLQKVAYRYDTMERRDSTAYSYAEDIETITCFDEKNFIKLISKNRFDKFNRNIECIDYNSNGKEIRRETYKYDKFGFKEKKIYVNGQNLIVKRTSLKNRKIIHELYNEGINQGGAEYTFDDKNRLIHLFNKESNAYYQASWSYNNNGLIDKYVEYQYSNQEWVPFLIGYYTYEKWE